MTNPFNLPGVKTTAICWKCEAAMKRDEENKQWKCPKDGTITTDKEIEKAGQQ